MWERLEKWYNNIKAKMTKARYLDMCEQLGTEPDPLKMPPDLSDFPEVVQNALDVFNKLGDRIASDIGYLGKDYSILSVYLENVEDKETFLDILSWMDGKVIVESAEEMKRARDKIKSK
jgi:hypothetical protein